MMDTTYSQTSATLLEGVACGGDPRAEERFFERYSALAQRVARAARVHSNDLEDVVQEAVAAAVLALREGRYLREVGRFKAWFKGILFHKINHLRREHSRAAGTAVDRVVRAPALYVLDRQGQGCQGSHPRADRIEDIADPAPGPAEQAEAAFEAAWLESVRAAAVDVVRDKIKHDVNWQAYVLVENQNWKPAAAARMLGVRRSQVYNAVSRIRAHLEETLREMIAH